MNDISICRGCWRYQASSTSGQNRDFTVAGGVLGSTDSSEHKANAKFAVVPGACRSRVIGWRVPQSGTAQPAQLSGVFHPRRLDVSIELLTYCALQIHLCPSCASPPPPHKLLQSAPSPPPPPSLSSPLTTPPSPPHPHRTHHPFLPTSHPTAHSHLLLPPPRRHPPPPTSSSSAPPIPTTSSPPPPPPPPHRRHLLPPSPHTSSATTHHSHLPPEAVPTS
eukprot:jgi/Botrbrau1/23266/Bobra.0102s0011.1